MVTTSLGVEIQEIWIGNLFERCVVIRFGAKREVLGLLRLQNPVERISRERESSIDWSHLGR